jgi:opacity protein-like surface antigen
MESFATPHVTKKCALIYESEWPFCNSGRVFAVRNLVGTCASVSPSLYWQARPGQWEQILVAGRAGLQLSNEASARRRHGGRFIVGLLLLGALSAGAGAARAADLASKTQASVFEPPPPEFSWTGFYLGIHAGGGLDHFAFPFGIFVPEPGGFFKGTSGITASGPIGGLQAGFNYELPFFHIVAGVEIDNSASGIRGQTTVNRTPVSGAPATAVFGSKFEDFGTARLRLGYPCGRFLPYLTGGFTYGTIETSTSPRQGSLAPDQARPRARAYFPMSGQPAAASNIPSRQTSR